MGELEENFANDFMIFSLALNDILEDNNIALIKF